MSDTGVYDQQERAPFKLDIGRIGLIIVLPVILWAFYTTSSGMADIMRKDPDDYFGLVGAVIGSAAVLALLALTSWSLGSDLAALLTRQTGLAGPPIPKVLLIGAVFAFVFCVSAFFSFTYYYNNIRGLSTAQITNEQMPSELMNEIITPLEKAVGSVYENESKKIAGSAGMITYFEQLDAILKVSGTGGSNFREQVRVAQAAQSKANAELAKESEGRRKEAADAKRQLGELEGKILSLDRDIADLDKIIGPKQKEIEELATTIKLEEQEIIDAVKGLDKRGTGCGENCKYHMALKEKAQQTQKTIKDTLVAPTKEKDIKVLQRNKLRDEIGPLRTKSELSEGGAPKQPIAAAVPDLGADATVTLRDFSEARDRVRLDPTWEKVNKVKTSCEIILKIERQLKIAPELPGDFSCEPLSSDARELLTARQTVLAGKASFEQKCSLRGEIGKTISELTKKVTADKKRDGLAEAKKPIDECIYAARDAGLAETDVQAFIKHSNEFSRDNNALLNKFALARRAFFSGTSDSSLAIAVAVVQDAFILILKLLSDIFSREARPRKREESGPPLDISDYEYDAPEIRAAKAVLREAQPVRSGTSRLTVASTADLPPEVRDNIRALVNRFVRQGKAHMDRNENYFIENSAIHAIESEIRNLSQTPRPSDTPRPTTPALRRNDRLEAGNAQANAGQDAFVSQETAAPARSGPRRGPSALMREYFSAGVTKRQTVPGRPVASAQHTSSGPGAEQTLGAGSSTDGESGGIRFDQLRARRQNAPES